MFFVLKQRWCNEDDDDDDELDAEDNFDFFFAEIKLMSVEITPILLTTINWLWITALMIVNSSLPTILIYAVSTIQKKHWGWILLENASV